MFGEVLRTIMAVLALSAPVVPSTRDDTASLQAELDAAQDVTLPALPDGSCYRTRGLWVSRNDTVISSPDGACIEALGPGDTRLSSSDGDPIAANAIFVVSRSAADGADPVNVTIRGLRLVVPDGLGMMGTIVAATQVEIDAVHVEGAPVEALAVTGRGSQQGVSQGVFVHDSTFAGGTRNVISVTSVRGFELTRCDVSGASDTNGAPGNPAAGLDIEPNSIAEPVVDIRIQDNRIAQNAGPGILLALAPNEGAPAEAGPIEILGNRIEGNGTKETPPVRGGIIVEGGQADGKGRVTIAGNEIRGNAGYGLGGHPASGTTMVIDAHDNVFAGNTAGRWGFVHTGRGSRLAR
jgi:hypothetical protein